MIDSGSGGTLSLKLKNGDFVELIIPPAALLYNVEVSLQEVESVRQAQFPAGARYSSVEISPNGTQLNHPATLIFKPKVGYPLSTLTPFSADASGNDVQIALVQGTPTNNEIKLSLFHFSNYTISDELSLDQIVTNGVSTMHESQAASWLAHQLLIDKKNGTNEVADIMSYLQQLFDNIVKPAARQVNSCSTANTAADRFINWKRKLDLLGLEPVEFYPPKFELDLSKALKKPRIFVMSSPKKPVTKTINPSQF